MTKSDLSPQSPLASAGIALNSPDAPIHTHVVVPQAVARKPHKIAFVFDDSLDKPDGVQQYILTLGRYFAAQDLDVHYLVGETTRTDIPNVHSLGKNIHVRFNQNRMSIPLPVSKRKIREILAREQFDILHVQVPYSPMLAARVINAAGRRTGVVGTFHIAPHSQLVHFANSFLRLLLGRSLKRFDEMVHVSPVAQTFARETFHVGGEVVPNAVTLSSFYGAEPFEKYVGTPTILFLGRLVERKGCRQLLEAIAILQARFAPNTSDLKANDSSGVSARTSGNRAQVAPTFRVLVCGTGPLDAELKAFVAEHNLQDVVEFVGFVSEADKPRYLASADITVFPSTGGESFGIVVVEAMAASCGAVLAGNNPGYAALLHEHTDALVDPHDPVALADHLAQLLNDKTARAKAAQWQQAFVRQFDAPVVAAKIMAHYEAALRERRD